jgi:hypothetical protein
VSSAALRKRLDRLAQVPDIGIRLATTAVERIAEQEAVRAAGGHVTLGKKKRRVKLTAVSRVKGSGNAVAVTVWGKPTGPWVWIDTGTSAHTIPKRKPTAKKPRPMYGQGYDHPVQRKQIHHPGAHGKRAWQQVRKRAEIIVPELLRDEVHKVVTSG